MKPFLEKGLPNESCILEISPCSLMRRGRLLRPLFYSTICVYPRLIHVEIKRGNENMSKISHILLKNPVVVPTGTKLNEAVALLKKNKVTSLLVSSGGRLDGIVSVVDIAYSMPGRNRDITVDEVMHSPEITIDSDKWITEALEMFRRCNVSHLAVVENGEKVGIIRAEDILHTYRFNKEGSYR